jgi:hypothetical protein
MDEHGKKKCSASTA